MNQDIYSSLPTPGMSHILHTHLQRSLVKELLGLVERAQDIIGVPLQELSDKLSRLQSSNDALSPDVYGFHAKLLRALASGDGAGLKKALVDLSRYPEEQLAVSSFAITTFDEAAPSDSSILDYVLSSEGPRSKQGEMPTVHPLSETEMDVQSKYVEEALRIIKDVDEGSYEEIQEYTSHIVLFDGIVLVGITSMRAFGKIYIRIPEQDLSEEEKVAYYIEHIVHEGAHLHLHGIMMHDRLVLNSDEERFPAPIRADLRPMYGIFHATFVLSRMARVFRKWNEASGLTVAHTEYEKALSRFERGYETVARHARLTEAGKRVVATLRQAALMEPQ